MRTIALVVTTLALLPLTTIGARADGPWCAYYYKGSTNCGFYSFAQCQAAISGVGGSCATNPSYQGSGRRSRGYY